MKKLKKTIEEYHLTNAELAEWLDLSPGRISQLTDQGVLEKLDSGLYDLQASVSNYARFLSAPHIYG